MFANRDGLVSTYRSIGWLAAYVVSSLVARAGALDQERTALVGAAAGVGALWIGLARPGTRALDTVLLGSAAWVLHADGVSPTERGMIFALAAVAQAWTFRLAMTRLGNRSSGRRGACELRRVTDVTALFVAAALACGVGAAVGTLGLVWSGSSHNGLAATYAYWWGRNASGLLLVATTGLVLSRSVPNGVERVGLTALRTRLLPLEPQAAVETMVAAAASGLLLLLVFAWSSPRPLSFVLLFATVLVSTRLRPLGVALHGLLTGVVVVSGTMQGAGPFAAATSAFERALTAQLFVVLSVLTGLVLAVGRLERREVIQDLERAERAIAHRAEHLEAVLAHLDEGVLVVTSDGQQLSRNARADELLGLLENEVGNHARVSQHGLAPGVTALVRAFKGEVIEQDVAVMTPTGARRMLAVTAAPLENDPSATVGELPRIVVTIRDVTADRLQREQLSSFAGVVAHDLTRPLTVVTGWIHALAEAYDECDAVGVDEAMPMLNRARNAAAAMDDLVRDLLAYAVTTDGTANDLDVDLSALAEEVAAQMHDHDPEPLVEVQQGLWVHVDPVMAQQLVGNLVSNAVKYVARGRRPHVKVTGVRHLDHVRVSVEDNGIGVPEEDRVRIFEDFERAASEQYAGTGLGLAICRRVVERYAGTIRVSDAASGGSVFEFTLPLPKQA